MSPMRRMRESAWLWVVALVLAGALSVTPVAQADGANAIVSRSALRVQVVALGHACRAEVPGGTDGVSACTQLTGISPLFQRVAHLCQRMLPSAVSPSDVNLEYSVKQAYTDVNCGLGSVGVGAQIPDPGVRMARARCNDANYQNTTGCTQLSDGVLSIVVVRSPQLTLTNFRLDTTNGLAQVTRKYKRNASLTRIASDRAALNALARALGIR